MASSLSIVVTGLIARHFQLGGITWHYLQYLLGLSQLGHDVLYVEDSGETLYDLEHGAREDGYVVRDCRRHLDHLAKILSRFGLADRWAYRFPLEDRWYGLPDAQRRERLRSADLVLNLSGTLLHPEQYRVGPRLAYVDTDPVVTQARIAMGRRMFSARVAAHDVHFSFGEHIGPDVPPTPYDWRPTRQPIVLSEWQPQRRARDVFTTVMSWTSYEPVRWKGRAYAQKDVEFQSYLDLPGRLPPGHLEVALGGVVHADWQTNAGPSNADADAVASDPVARLRGAGWQVVDAGHCCGDLDRYRDYIRSSKAEWSVAKNAYVQGRPGWFSERSACYLAAGRPVVVQDTGLDGLLPLGEGLLTFRDPDGAVAAIEQVESEYARHSRAARDVAETCFAAEKVLPRLLAEAMGDA